MKVLICLICVIAFIILYVIICLKKIKYDEVYVYERLGKVSVAKEGKVLFIPFIDRIKSHLTIKDEMHTTMLNECTIVDDVVLQYKLTIFYDVLDPIKVTYELKDVDEDIDETIKTVFPNVVKEMPLDEIVRSERKIVEQTKEEIKKITESKGYVVTEIKIDNIMEKAKYIGDIEI